MQYGLKTLAVKNLKSIQLGLKAAFSRSYLYGTLFLRVLGLGGGEALREDEISVIMRGHFLFEDVKQQWKARSLSSEEVGLSSQVNLNNGGEIPVTELIDGVYRASFLQKESMNRMLTKLMPDSLEKEEN